MARVGLRVGCVCLSLSVPGVSTARPSACADQPSRRFTACRGTRRGRPRRRWRARHPSRAAHRCPVYGLRERPTWLLPSSCGGSVTKTRGAEPVRRVAVARIRPTSRRHNGDASHMAGHASGALAFKASCELPALAVRRMLRQHDCRHWLASDGGEMRER